MSSYSFCTYHLQVEGPGRLFGEVVGSHPHVQPMPMVGNREKEKRGAVCMRDLASHRLTWVTSEALVLRG